MDKNIDYRDNGNLLQHREEFEMVYGIISAHKKRAMSAMHNEYIAGKSRNSSHPMMIKLCHSKWHKFQVYCFRRVGQTIRLL